MQDKFGIFMECMRCKVTNEPRDKNFGTILPCQIGFKKNDVWCNVWVDVMVTEKTAINHAPSNGDLLTVSGRMDYREYNGKPQWSVWADTVVPYGNMNQGPQSRQPFDGGNNGDIGECPF
jgi:hypothetical protein